MRTLRALSVLAVVVLLIAPAAIAGTVSTSDPAPSVDLKTAPSKVCHPKSTVTCRASDVLALEAKAETKTAAICMGPRWNCKASTLTPATETKQQPVQSAAICMGPRWNCKTKTLN